jgi:hypothetical protein
MFGMNLLRFPLSIVWDLIGPIYGGENSHIEALNFYPIFIPLDECIRGTKTV